MATLYDFTATALSGADVPLANYRGKVVLIVNTASECGFTPQYAGLETLFRAYKDPGFVVLGFPCNQFGAQEPGDAAEIADFCKRAYDVSFPMFAKIAVNGPDESPLYTWLKRQAPGLMGTRRIKWNFTKFLIDRTGKVRARYAPSTSAQALRANIEALL